MVLVHLTHVSLGWFGKNKRVDFRNLSSKSANSDFPFTLYVLARHYTTGGYAAAIFPLGECGPLVRASLSYQMIKEAGPGLVGPLVSLFNASLQLRKVPDEWRKSIIKTGIQGWQEGPTGPIELQAHRTYILCCKNNGESP